MVAKKRKVKVKKTKKEINTKETFEFNFNINKLKNLYENKKNLISKLLPIILLFFLIFYSAYIRYGSVNLNGLKSSIEANTYNNIKYIIAQQINSEYPMLNPIEKQKLVEKKYNEVLKTKTINLQGQILNIDDLVEQNFKLIKDKFQIDGQTYLTAIDPYTFYRYSWNIMEHGRVGETLKYNPKTGKEEPFDTFRLAPQGAFAGENMHIRLEYILYKLYGLNKNSPLSERFRAIFLLPVFIVMLSVIPTFLILRKLTNDLFATLGTLTLFSVGTFVSRTTAGFVDTDAYNVLFPLYIVFFVILSLYEENKIKSIVYSILSGIFMILFLKFWGEGKFIFIFVMLSYIGYIIYNLLQKYLFKSKNELLVPLFSFLFFFITSDILSLIFLKTELIYSSFMFVYGRIHSLASISKTYIWPNVLSTVAELNPASFNSIMDSIGGKISFILALIGLFLLVFKNIKLKNKTFYYSFYFISILWFIIASVKYNLIYNSNNIMLSLFFLLFPVILAFVMAFFTKSTDISIFLGFLLSAWFAGTIYMCLNGVRFILLFATPSSILLTLGLYYSSKELNKLFKYLFETKNSFYSGEILMIITFLFLFFPLFKTAQAINDNSTPNLTDGWYNTLIKIKNESKENAIISSWWDFGHEFAAIADRGVTFDGASQATPQSHWIGKVLMSNDENEVLGILRMLVCSGNNAFTYIENITNPKDSGVNIVENLLYKILPYNLTDEKRIEIIKSYKYYNFSDSEIQKIISLVNCKNPPNDYFITSEDMVGKSGVWAHWGSWNFTKKFVYDNYKIKSPEEIANILDRNKSIIEKLVNELENLEIKANKENKKFEDLVNQWLAPYPSYIAIRGKYLFNCKLEDKLIECSELGLSIDPYNGTIKGLSNFNVKRLIVPSINNTIKIYNLNNESSIDLTLIPLSKDNYNILFSVYPLGNSLFTKLFYLDGYGIKYFKPFYSVETVQGWKVSTWKVDWAEIKNESINS